MKQDQMTGLLGATLSVAPDAQAEFVALKVRIDKSKRIAAYREYIKQSRRLTAQYGQLGKAVAA